MDIQYLPTQHFKVFSLEELTPDLFEIMNKKQEEYKITCSEFYKSFYLDNKEK